MKAISVEHWKANHLSGKNKINYIIQSYNTDHRGNLLVCSVKNKNKVEYGVMDSLSELKDVINIKNVTPEFRSSIKNRLPKRGFVWIFENVEKVIEMPIDVKTGVWNFRDEHEVIIYSEFNGITEESINKTQEIIDKLPTEQEVSTEEKKRTKHKYYGYLMMLLVLGLISWGLHALIT